MTLKDYLLQTSEGDEITVWDKDYDIEVYFYNQTGDAWDNAMMDFADKLEVVNVSNGGVTVNMYDVIEDNIEALEASDLFLNPTVDDIMDDMENILAGYVSEDWLVKFVSCLNQEGGNVKKYIKESSAVKASVELDERFSFDLEPEFEIYLDTSLAKPVCRVEDTEVIGNGAGLMYDVVISIPSEEAHWQIREDIERNLERYIQDEVEGSDYMGSVISIDDDGWGYDNDRLYRAKVEVVAIQNVSPWGEYGIDYGTEEYLDHITKGTPWPPEYE